MILYRVIPKSNTNISNNKIKGFNTFEYNDNLEYIHFFLLPQNANTYQFLKYQQNNIESIILKCDIPISQITFGIGLYFWYYHFKHVPFLEARINKNDFQNSYIKEISSYPKNDWNDYEIFKRYLVDCIYQQKAFKYIDDKKYIIKLNKKFNFIYYISKSDLEKENISLDNYPKEISFKFLKKKELSVLKRILITLKEKIEKTTEFDINFIDLNYYEQKYNK